MDDFMSSPPTPKTRKRSVPDEQSPEKKPLNLKGTQFIMPTPPDTAESSNASPTTAELHGRTASPSPSCSSLSSVQVASSHATPSSNALVSTTVVTSTSGAPPAKRRKLTPAEKEDKKRFKEAKAAEKAEKKARQEEEKLRKDEEKAKRDEEKRAKDEEKRKKAEEREAKRREKELEEERKDQDKIKKERSQLRLAAFFQRPSTPAKSPAAVRERNENPFDSARRKSLSLEPYDAVVEQIQNSVSPTKGTLKPAPLEQKILVAAAKRVVSDYRKYFLPFELPSHSSLALTTLELRSMEEQDAAQAAFDYQFSDGSIQEKYDLGLVQSYASIESYFATERANPRGQRLPSARQLIEQLQDSSIQPIDLTQDRHPQQSSAPSLQGLSLRYLHFHEDVRPPFSGTYTKLTSPRAARRLARNPFARERQDTDYDYDSEAEWDDAEEGEDIDLGDEDDEGESLGDAEEEMEGFLDDEGDELKSRRRMITGDLQPVSTGLCWENLTSEFRSSRDIGAVGREMRGMRMQWLLPNVDTKTAPIDPFSSAYWQAESFPAPAPLIQDFKSNSTSTTTQYKRGPGRPPLKDKLNSSGSTSTPPLSLKGAAEGEKGPITAVASNSQPGKKLTAAKVVLRKEDLEEFKDAVVGSPLGKLDLLKGLKTRFPKMTNETIKETLGLHFAQMGVGKADKKWVSMEPS